jgi:hypothetical protein
VGGTTRAALVAILILILLGWRPGLSQLLLLLLLSRISDRSSASPTTHSNGREFMTSRSVINN